MKAKKWVAVVALLAAIALFVPFVPQTQASGRFLGAYYQHTAVVSPTYYVFHCGSYINSQASVQVGNISSVYQASKGYTFACNYSSS
jgi:hypothetical protein